MALYSSESNRAWVSFKDGEWLECDVTHSTQTQLSLRSYEDVLILYERKHSSKLQRKVPIMSKFMPPCELANHQKQLAKLCLR